MESRFGENFARVRVHTGVRAAEAAGTLEAEAYTTGRDIVFDADLYAPHTQEGLRLLAHELAHVVQQSRAAAGAGSGDLEGEAESSARAVAGGGVGRVRLSAPRGRPQLARKGKVRIKVIPDESQGVLRVVRVDERGKIVAGLAEIVPPTGTPLDEHAVEVPPEGAGPDIRLMIPKEYAGTVNPAQPVKLQRKPSEAEVHEQQRIEYYEQLRQDLMLYARETGDEFGLGQDLAAQYIAASAEELEKRAEEIGYDRLRRVSSHYARLRQALIEYEKHKRLEVEKEFGISVGTDADAEERYADADPTDLKLAASDRGFRAWREAREAAREEAEEMAKARRAEAMFPPGFEFSPSEARAIVEGDESETLRDEKTGKLIGYYTYETSEKALGGAVGTVARELRAPDGRLIESTESTVLTPTAETLQDLVRNAPYLRNTINVIEAASGVSLDLRDYGRLLSAAERGNRVVSTVPYGETVRAAAEVAAGCSLSFTDYGRVLSPAEIKQRAGQVALDLATVGVSKVTARAGARAGQPHPGAPSRREAGAPAGPKQKPETAPPPPPPAKQPATSSAPVSASGDRGPGAGAGWVKRAPPRRPAEKRPPPEPAAKAERAVPAGPRAGGAGRKPPRDGRAKPSPPPPPAAKHAPRTESAAEFQARGGKITRLPPGPSGGEQVVRPKSASPGSLPEGTHRVVSGGRRAHGKTPEAGGPSQKRKPGAGKAGNGYGKKNQATPTKKKGAKKGGGARQGRAAGKTAPEGKARKGGGRAGAKAPSGAAGAQQTPGPAAHVRHRGSDGATVITTEVGPPQTRKGYEKELFPSVELDLKGWHRAHSHGAGTGTEVEAGILYAPPKVNLELQNQGVEKRIRELYQAKPADTKLILTTETFAHSRTRRLKEIRYRVTAVRGDETEIKFEASIEVENKRSNPRVRGDVTFPTP